MKLRNALMLSALISLSAMTASGVLAQGRAPAENWWVDKSPGGVYKAPMRPLWKLSDLKKMHAGQDNWSQQIIKDPEQDVTYNSGKPGFAISPRMHPDTYSAFVVIAGDMTFNVEGQQPVAATRGSIVTIPKTAIFSAAVAGSANALWVEINPINYKTVYPASEPKPAPGAKGNVVVKVAFAHTPGAYHAPTKLHYNLFQAIAACDYPGVKVQEEHVFINPLVNFANPADNKCAKPPAPGAPAARPAAGGGGDAAATGPFNPKSTFGHMHPGPAEWWIVQTGHISGKFENTGEFHAEEGDVLYAAPMMWHQMGVEGAGPSVRTAMGGYELINMNNTGEPAK